MLQQVVSKMIMSRYVYVYKGKTEGCTLLCTIRLEVKTLIFFQILISIYIFTYNVNSVSLK